MIMNELEDLGKKGTWNSALELFKLSGDELCEYPLHYLYLHVFDLILNIVLRFQCI